MGTPTPLRARFGLDNLSNVIRNIGNESNISASSAGAGALRINSNTLQISDGTSWNNVGSGSSLRVVTLTDAATVTPNADTTDIGVLTSLSQTTTFANPTGTPTNGQLLQIRITSSTSRSIAFGTAYGVASGLSFPLATTGGGVEDYIAWRYSSNATKWIMVATTIGALPTGLKTAVATVDFTTPSTGRFFSVSVANALAGDRIVATPSLVMPSGVAEDELEFDPIFAYGSCTTNGTVRLFVGSTQGGFIIGQRNINLLIG